MMERKIVCDLNLVSVDFGREEELRSGNTFRFIPTHQRPANWNDRGLRSLLCANVAIAIDASLSNKEVHVAARDF